MEWVSQKQSANRRLLFDKDSSNSCLNSGLHPIGVVSQNTISDQAKEVKKLD
jgi:plastocyanin domain-containing protein